MRLGDWEEVYKTLSNRSKLWRQVYQSVSKPLYTASLEASVIGNDCARFPDTFYERFRALPSRITSIDTQERAVTDAPISKLSVTRKLERDLFIGLSPNPNRHRKGDGFKI